MRINFVRRLFIFLAPLLGIFLLTYLTPAAPNATVITLDPGTTHQTISGWQAVAEIGQNYLPNDFLLWRDTVIDLASNDLGINRIMVQVKSTYENPNDNDDPFLIDWSGFDFSEIDLKIDEIIIPLKQSLESRGESLHINLKYHNGGNPTIHSDDSEEYAELIEATFLHIQNTYGWVPDSIDIVNEPNSSKGWSATKIGDAILATANRLQPHGFTPSFFAPSRVSVHGSVSWFDQMANSVPEALQYLDELSYHCYGGCSDDANLIDVGDRTLTYNIGSSMTEKIGHDYEDLHRDLKLAHVSGWEQFALAFPIDNDDGAQYYWIDISDSENPVVNIGSRTKFLRQYFKFIRNGAVRIEANSNDGNFDPLAFINTNECYVVVVKADQGGNITIQELPAGEYGIKYTTTDEYDVDLPNVTIGPGQDLNTNIPSPGVITIYGLATTPGATSTSSPTTSPTSTLEETLTSTSTPTPTSTSAGTSTSTPTPTCTLVPAFALFISLVINSK